MLPFLQGLQLGSDTYLWSHKSYRFWGLGLGEKFLRDWRVRFRFKRGQLLNSSFSHFLSWNHEVWPTSHSLSVWLRIQTFFLEHGRIKVRIKHESIGIGMVWNWRISQHFGDQLLRCWFLPPENCSLFAIFKICVDFRCIGCIMFDHQHYSMVNMERFFFTNRFFS